MPRVSSHSGTDKKWQNKLVSSLSSSFCCHEMPRERKMLIICEIEVTIRGVQSMLSMMQDASWAK